MVDLITVSFLLRQTMRHAEVRGSGGWLWSLSLLSPDLLSLLPQTCPCAWRMGTAAARAGLRSATRACGARCATTTGTSGTLVSCAGCWVAAELSQPRGAAASARAQGPSCWTTCAARAPKTRWTTAATLAGRGTTASTRRTRA